MLEAAQEHFDLAGADLSVRIIDRCFAAKGLGRSVEPTESGAPILKNIRGSGKQSIETHDSFRLNSIENTNLFSANQSTARHAHDDGHFVGRQIIFRAKFLKTTIWQPSLYLGNCFAGLIENQIAGFV